MTYEIFYSIIIRVENQESQVAAQAPTVEEKKDGINISKEELGEIVARGIEAALKSFQSSNVKEKMEETNRKISEVVNSTASTLLTAPTVPRAKAVDYIKSILEEDAYRRMASNDGSNRINFKEETLKWKIIAEHERTNATPEELAAIYEDCFE